jgi:hypothetical protein
MHRRPKFDLSYSYFVKAYQDECTCLRLHLQLVGGILNHQVSRVFNIACEEEDGTHESKVKIMFSFHLCDLLETTF